jgi:hypothetical protein
MQGGNESPSSYLATFLPYCFVLAYIGQENYNEALTQLENVYETRGIIMTGLKVDPELDPIRNEPRFKALLKKMNLD